MAKKLLFGVFVFLSAGSAFAFGLGDHGRVTREALFEAAQCLPALKPILTKQGQDEIVTAVIEEDLNLIRKWMTYSHYYNPYKTLDMRRADSSLAVSETEASLRTVKGPDLEDTYFYLGRVMHYLQDAASPAHVVPVEHNMSDGFESFTARPIQPGNGCDWAAESVPTDLVSLLQLTAIETYSRLDEKIHYRRSGTDQLESWFTLFWTAGEGHEFGRYGDFGNRFGESSFDINGEPVQVSPELYQQFKERQLESAVVATRRALLWFLKVQENQ